MTPTYWLLLIITIAVVSLAAGAGLCLRTQGKAKAAYKHNMTRMLEPEELDVLAQARADYNLSIVCHDDTERKAIVRSLAALGYFKETGSKGSLTVYCLTPLGFQYCHEHDL